MESRKESAAVISGRVRIEDVRNIQPGFIVSYNYSFLIPEDVIGFMRGKIINLHISLLPWNRGSSPNIWSFVENTPKGVTIHQVSPVFDTGKILFQKELFLDKEQETFSSSYQKLNDAITALFIDKWEDILMGNYVLEEQIGKGSYHTTKDLRKLREKYPFVYDDNIGEYLRKYALHSGRYE